MQKVIYFFLFLMTIVSVQAQEVADEYAWLTDIASKYPIVLYILSGLGTLMILAQVVVAITPSKKDDEWLAKAQSAWYWKIIDIISRFAPIKKK